jgi:NAD(P)H dehydrogenase (quinone)
MRVFLVIAHPEPNRRSFLHAIYRKAIETLKLNHHEVVTCDLYDSDFAMLPSLADFDNPNPELSYAELQKQGCYNEEILRTQAKIEWCTHLLLFTPLCWLTPSAALMGWWEKVFGEGWAWGPGQTYSKGYLAGKKAMMVITCGQDQRFYGNDAVNVTVEELMYPILFRCLAKVGFTCLRTQAFFGVETANAQARVDILNGWAEHVMNLETREAIEFQTEQEEPGHAGAGPRLLEGDKVSNRKLLANLGDMILIKPKDPYAFYD